MNLADRDRLGRQHPEAIEVIDGLRWGVIDTGPNASGRTLLLLPGTLGRADIFWQQILALKDRVRVLAVTYPRNADLDRWVICLARLLDRRGIADVTVLGSSLGGYLAQLFAARQPERTIGLIAANTLSSTAGIAGQPPYSADIAALPVAALRRGFRDRLAAWGATHPAQAGLVTLLLAEVDGRIPAGHLKARMQALKVAPPLPPVGLASDDVAIVECDDDPLIPPPIRQTVHDHLDAGVCYRFRHGGHFPYVVRSDEYTAMLFERLGLADGASVWGAGRERAA